MRSSRLTGALLATAVGAVLVLGGCGDGSDDDAEDPAAGTTPVELADRTFVSEQVEGYAMVEGTVVALSFEDDVMAVSAGCNTMTGAYTHEGDTLAWTGEPATTRMGCEPELMDQDAWLAGLFTEGVEVSDSDEDADLVVESFDVRIPFVER